VEDEEQEDDEEEADEETETPNVEALGSATASRNEANQNAVETASPLSRPKMGSWVRTPDTSSPGATRMTLNSVEETCAICCNDVPPRRSVRLPCSHGWYCAQCVLRHADARLAVGATHVACPECCTPIAERDLRKMLPAETIDRLLARSLEQAVSSAADLWACPTPNCPMRVALEEGEEPRLNCTICKKSSCLKCHARPFHRGRTCEEHAERVRARKVKKQEDHQANDQKLLMEWIQKTGTKQCPTCHAAITKQNLDGQSTQYKECHKMLCRNCNTRFCFKCLAVLTATYTCGCSIKEHGFVDPVTGKRMNHLNRRYKKPINARSR